MLIVSSEGGSAPSLISLAPFPKGGVSSITDHRAGPVTLRLAEPDVKSRMMSQTGYSPFQVALRFSTKAFIPSFWSWEAKSM
jgi:hypothetical protein